MNYKLTQNRTSTPLAIGYSKCHGTGSLATCNWIGSNEGSRAGK